MAGVNVRLPLLAWEARRRVAAWRRRAGDVVLAGIVLCVLAGVCALDAWRQAQRLPELAAMQSQLQQRGRVQEPVDDRQRLRDFHDYLVPQSTIPGTVNGILARAASLGLVLKTGQYRAEPVPVGGFLRYHVMLPVEGSGAAVQDFLLAVLREQRTLALESVTIQRERLESQRIRANLRFVLLTRLDAVEARP